MAEVQIPDYIDDQLNELAATTGQSKDDLILEALAYSFNVQQEDRSLPLSEFTAAELERMDRSVEQLRRGEFITGEEVSAIFAKRRKVLATQ